MPARDSEPAEDVRTIVYDFGLPELDESIPRVSTWTLISSLSAFYLTVILFTGSYASLFNLQSSLHFQSGVGTASLSSIYASSLLCYLFLSSLLIEWFGLTRTIPITLASMVLFFAAHFYPVWYILVPASLVAGAAGATLWTCIPVYLSQAAEVCRVIFMSDIERTLPRLFTLLFALIQAAVLIGSLITYYVLRPVGNDETEKEEEQVTSRDHHTTEMYLNTSSNCGADFCSSWSVDSSSSLRSQPEDYRVYMLCGIFGGCLLLAALIATTFIVSFNPVDLRKGERYRIRAMEEAEDEVKEQGKICESSFPFFVHIKETLALTKRTEFLLLVLLIYYQGLEMAFVSSEFTKAYVSCSLGVHYVSWVVCCYGALYMAGSFLLQGPVIQCLGRPALLASAAALGLTDLALLLIWKPPPQPNRDPLATQHLTLFLAAGIFGVTGSALHPQLKALYGLLLREEKVKGFAVMGVVDAMGGLTGFSLSPFLCLRPKIYLLMTVQVLGMAAYLVLEWKLRNKNKVRTKKLPLTC